VTNLKSKIKPAEIQIRIAACQPHGCDSRIVNRSVSDQPLIRQYFSYRCSSCCFVFHCSNFVREIFCSSRSFENLSIQCLRGRFVLRPLHWIGPRSHDRNVFHLPRSHIHQLSRKFNRRFDHCLAVCALRKSRIRNAGRGVFLLEPALSGQILLKYGGIRISFTEADRLTELVRHYDGFKFLRKITADFHMLFI